jgi:hypothetical protein
MSGMAHVFVTHMSIASSHVSVALHGPDAACTQPCESAPGLPGMHVSTPLQKAWSSQLAVHAPASPPASRPAS